jgi:putative solute:sodium symporter small subunit
VRVNKTAEGPMQLSQKHIEYWGKNLRITAILMVIWFVVTFVIGYYAIGLSEITFMGWPIPFYMGAQGSLAIYVLIIWFYASYMNKLDKKYGVHEGEGE